MDERASRLHGSEDLILLPWWSSSNWSVIDLDSVGLDLQSRSNSRLPFLQKWEHWSSVLQGNVRDQEEPKESWRRARLEDLCFPRATHFLQNHSNPDGELQARGWTSRSMDWTKFPGGTAYIYGQLVLDRGAKTVQQGRQQPSQETALEWVDAHTHPYLTPPTKINQNWIKDLTVRATAIKPFDIGADLHNLGGSSGFLERAPKARDQRK